MATRHLHRNSWPRKRCECVAPARRRLLLAVACLAALFGALHIQAAFFCHGTVSSFSLPQ
eukprot:2951254-Prorocentrum_lima.AAC.1